MNGFRMATYAALAVIAASCGQNAEIAVPQEAVEELQEVGPEGLLIGTPLSAFPTAQASLADLATDCLVASGHEQALSAQRTVAPDTALSEALSTPGRFRFIPASRYSAGHLFDTQCSTYTPANGAAPSALTTELAVTLSGRRSVDDINAYAAAPDLVAFVEEPASQLELVGSFTFDGVERPTRLLFVSGRLSTARISFGAFSETKLQQLITALDEQYDLIDPSEAEFRDYDALHRSCVGFATQDRSVALSVARTQQARINNWVGELWVTYTSPDAPRQLVSSECFPAAALPHSQGGL